MPDELSTELLAAEGRLQAAQLAGDVAALDQLLHDRLLAVGPDGELVTKEMDLASHRDRVLTLSTLEQLQLEYVVADRTGVTAVLMALTGANAGTPFDVRMRYVRTWVYDDGWRILAAHVSLA